MRLKKAYQVPMQNPSKEKAKRRDRWFVSRRLRIVLRGALVMAIFMLANTLYLLLNRLADAFDWTFFAAGETSLPALFQAMILSHTGGGLLLVALMLGFGIGHLPKGWKRYKKQIGRASWRGRV